MRGYIQKHGSLVTAAFLWFFCFVFFIKANSLTSQEIKEEALGYFDNYCFSCHNEDLQKGNLDLTRLLKEDLFDKSVVFENLIVGRMPPEKKKQPTIEEKRVMLKWLSQNQIKNVPNPYRRISRHEFVHSANDLLNIDLDLTSMIPEDRGTHDFDSDRRVLLT